MQSLWSRKRPAWWREHRREEVWQRGVTLVEIVVSIGVIAILAVLLLSSMKQVAETRSITVCVANLKQIGVGHAAYGADHQGAMITCATPIKGALKNTYRWYNVLEPYMGVATKPDGPDRPKWQQCPGKKLSYENLYAVGYGWNFQSFGLNPPGVEDPRNPGSMSWGSGSRFSAVNQPGQTIVVGDSHDADAPFEDWQNFLLYWGGTGNDAKLPRRHRGGGNFLMADGHVQSLTFPEVTGNNYYLFRRKN